MRYLLYITYDVWSIDCVLIGLDAHMFRHNGYGPEITDQGPGPNWKHLSQNKSSPTYVDGTCGSSVCCIISAPDIHILYHRSLVASWPISFGTRVCIWHRSFLFLVVAPSSEVSSFPWNVSFYNRAVGSSSKSFFSPMHAFHIYVERKRYSCREREGEKEGDGFIRAMRVSVH